MFIASLIRRDYMSLYNSPANKTLDKLGQALNPTH
jgi:hypothetical protein